MTTQTLKFYILKVSSSSVACFQRLYFSILNKLLLLILEILSNLTACEASWNEVIQIQMIVMKAE